MTRGASMLARRRVEDSEVVDAKADAARESLPRISVMAYSTIFKISQDLVTNKHF
jgi:hypothetical protein